MTNTEDSFQHFSDRFRHAYGKIAQTVPKSHLTGRFLDIGCGTGNGVAAAAAHGSRFAVGIDRNLEEYAHAVKPHDFEIFCNKLHVSTTRMLFIEMDIFKSKFKSSSFDYVIMLDSSEHVPNPKAFYQFAYDSLTPGGVFVVDTCPLYYGPVGHHLWHLFPINSNPWVHLKSGFADLCKTMGCSEWSWERFVELNRATHQDLRNAFVDVGFEIISEHRDEPSEKFLELYAKYGEGIDPEIPKSVLFEQWITLVGKKPLP